MLLISTIQCYSSCEWFGNSLGLFAQDDLVSLQISPLHLMFETEISLKPFLQKVDCNFFFCSNFVFTKQFQ